VCAQDASSGEMGLRYTESPWPPVLSKASREGWSQGGEGERERSLLGDAGPERLPAEHTFRGSSSNDECDFGM
jgi:hypothetical protein